MTVTETGDDIEFASDADRATWVSAGRPSLTGQAERAETPPDAALVEEVDALPSTSEEIQAELERTFSDHPNPIPSAIEVLVRYVESAAWDPAMREGIVGTFPLLDGAELATGTDELGRTGTLVRLADPDGGPERFNVIIDTEAGDLLEISRILTEDVYGYGLEPPIVTEKTTYTSLGPGTAPPSG